MLAALQARQPLILIEGEAGIGKTRLVKESLGVWTPGGRVLQVACPPLRDPFPLGPVVDALQQLGLAGVELSPLTGALRPLFPEWADQLPPALEPLEDPRATRHRLFRALMDLVARQAIDLIVVEDAHWADDSTLEFLLLLLTSAATRSPSIVITYRRTDVPEDSLLLRLTSRSTSSPPVRVALVALSRDETGQLVAAMLDNTEVSPGFVAFLHERTDGLPLAVEESVSLLQDRGDLVQRGGAWTRSETADLQVPPTVRDSVLERVQRLDQAARLTLAAAATLSAPATEDLLGQVAGLDTTQARVGVARSLESGLLRETTPGTYEFRHVLAARAVEDAIAVSERRHLHHQAAKALLEQDPRPVARLSRHFRQANDLAAWSTFAEQAAEVALHSGDDRAAVVLLLELVDSAAHVPERRADLARKLGEAATWGMAALGDLGARVTASLLDVLVTEDPPVDRGEIRLLLGRLLLQLGEFDAAAEQIEVAVGELSGQPALAARAMISLAWPRGQAWPAEKHRTWLNRATRKFAALPAGAERTWLDVDRASVLLMLGEEQGWQEMLDLRGTVRDLAGVPDLARTPDLGRDRQIARGLMNLGHVGIGWGRDAEARQSLEEAVELMRSTGYERLVNSARLTTAYLDWHAGRWDGLAERVARLADADDTLPEARLEARLIRALLAVVSGDRSSAQQELSDLLAETRRRGVVDAQLLPAAMLARFALTDDASGEALEITGPTMKTLVRKGMWLWGSALIPVHVEAIVASGQKREAKEIVRLFGDGLAGRNAPAPAAALLMCRGIVAEAAGQSETAAQAFADAAQAWSELPRPYEELLSRERQARTLLAGDHDPAPALEILGEVQKRLTDLGARFDADRAARLLRQHGVEVARVWRGGRRGYGDQLSPRELEVARLVAQGMTNRQVAESLFLSPRTVDRHLSAAMRKLGVTSRTALAVAAAETGLLNSKFG